LVEISQSGLLRRRERLLDALTLLFGDEATGSARVALLAACALFALSIIACAAFLTWMRRATTP